MKLDQLRRIQWNNIAPPHRGQLACAKPGCRRRAHFERHHTGCEYMWLWHFRAQRNTNAYKVFYARYFEFREGDCITLCKYHHKAIHRVYIVHIREWVAKKLFRPCKDWSWAEAEELMEHLRLVCRKWQAHG